MRAGQAVTIARHFAAARWRWERLHGKRLATYQERRARAIVRFANERSPFYHDHWAGHDLVEWRALPTVDKRQMMANFARFNTIGVSADEALEVALRAERSRDFTPTLRGVTVGLSSGTSGHRGVFLASPEEQAGWAGVILSRTLRQLTGRLRVAFFLRSNNNLYEQVGSALIQFQYFDLMTPLTEAIACLNLFQPHIVIGPPSLLDELADELTTSRLRIHPQRLISVAETLEPQDRVRLQGAFQAPVHEIYQCTEGLLAISCAHGSLHIQEDLVALQFEPLGDQGARSGTERVTPIVTDLWRRTQPIIRYRLNDVLRLADKRCRCGSDFRVIEAIEGRCDDVCYFVTNAGELRPFFPDVIRRMILLTSDAIAEYQAVQEHPGQLCVRVALLPVAEPDAVDEALRRSADETAARYGCRRMDLTIEHELELLAPDRKRRRVRRLYQE
ncbi:MAG TPA: F390 synthetase-related protein [Ktedonobacterales bacterium]|jgi:putative adenylate-forming enzyme|nr:F390 synthetase-related protein [Ktedonobacterales bacterium]